MHGRRRLRRCGRSLMSCAKPSSATHSGCCRRLEARDVFCDVCVRGMRIGQVGAAVSHVGGGVCGFLSRLLCHTAPHCGTPGVYRAGHFGRHLSAMNGGPAVAGFDCLHTTISAAPQPPTTLCRHTGFQPHQQSATTTLKAPVALPSKLPASCSCG